MYCNVYCVAFDVSFYDKVHQKGSCRWLGVCGELLKATIDCCELCAGYISGGVSAIESARGYWQMVLVQADMAAGEGECSLP